jgi:Carboxypeptidase regulatory-like domain
MADERRARNAPMTKLKLSFLVLSICLAGSLTASAQQLVAPQPQPGRISGTVTDVGGAAVPGASVVLAGPTQRDTRSVVANDDAFFQFDNIKPGVPYQVTVSAQGFASWRSDTLVLTPGQFSLLKDIKLTLQGETASVIVTASRTEIATAQVRMEEQQRVFGFIPNFYTVYDHNAVPLTAKLKFELALKVSVDPVTFAGTSFLAAADQASDHPNFVEGVKGYGQRFGAVYTNDLTDILIGGAILPSILHQDPRYFYQGTGTTKSRLLHALSSPMICKGDNGRWQPNISSLGGYLASGAIANAYYPESNRGAGLVFSTFAVDFGANVANGVLQEFVLRKFTPSLKNQR